MFYKLLGIACVMCAIASCGGEEVINEHVFSCPTKETPESCVGSSTQMVALNHVAGKYAVSDFIHTPKGYFQQFSYTFNEDGTYQLMVVGLQPILDCQGYSDGMGNVEESGTFSLQNGIITLQPAMYMSDDPMETALPAAYELRINQFNAETSTITLSGSSFCDATFQTVDL